MVQLFTNRNGTIGRAVNLEELGKELNITSVDDEMRLLVCPKCNKLDVIRKKATHAKCTCGVVIKMKERWYE